MLLAVLIEAFIIELLIVSVKSAVLSVIYQILGKPSFF